MDATTITATTTDPKTDGDAAGAVTQTADTTEANEEKKQADPKITAAFKALQEAGIEVFTKRQVNGRETALRTSLEKEATTKAEQATQEANRKALEAQQQFEPLYRTAQEEITTLKGQIATMEPVLVGMIEQNTKDWDKSLLESRPTEGGYSALATWYEANKKIAARIAELGTQGKAQTYAQNGGGGKLPTPSGTADNQEAARKAQGGMYRKF